MKSFQNAALLTDSLKHLRVEEASFSPHPKNPPTRVLLVFHRDEKMPLAFWDAEELGARGVKRTQLLQAVFEARQHLHAEFLKNPRNLQKPHQDIKEIAEEFLSRKTKVLYTAPTAPRRSTPRTCLN